MICPQDVVVSFSYQDRRLASTREKLIKHMMTVQTVGIVEHHKCRLILPWASILGFRMRISVLPIATNESFTKLFAPACNLCSGPSSFMRPSLTANSENPSSSLASVSAWA